LEDPLLLVVAEGEHLKVLSPQTGEVGFRKTHDLRAPGRGFGEELLYSVQPLIKGGRDTGRCEANNHASLREGWFPLTESRVRKLRASGGAPARRWRPCLALRACGRTTYRTDS